MTEAPWTGSPIREFVTWEVLYKGASGAAGGGDETDSGNRTAHWMTLTNLPCGFYSVLK